MQIHVARNAAQLGIFSPEEIIAGLHSGRFVAGDLAWREGMPAWTPLGDWPEFRSAAVPPSPGMATAAAPAPSSIPWEQGKSLGSFFATLKLAIAHPSALSTGRYAFGDWLVFCYFALLLTLPFQLVNALAFGDKNAQMAEFLGSLHIASADKFVEQLAHSPQAPAWVTAFGTVMGLAFAPLLYAFFALAHWVGQRIFRYQVPVERTVAATLLASAVLVVLMAPLYLLGFSMGVQFIVAGLFLIPAGVVYYRVFSAGTGIGPWVQFGISCFVWFILLCCCCVLPIMAISGAAAASLAR